MSTTKRQQFDRLFKLQVLRDIDAREPIAQAAREHLALLPHPFHETGAGIVWNNPRLLWEPSLRRHRGGVLLTGSHRGCVVP